MSRKPPAHVYAQTVALMEYIGMDRWEMPEYKATRIQHVNVQPASKTVLTKDNTNVQLTGLLFADSLYTAPAIDWQAAKDRSEAAGGPLSVIFEGRHYTVIEVAKLFNEFGAFDHWEVSLQ